MHSVVAQPITREAFAEYGDVIAVAQSPSGQSANQGSAVRYDWAAVLTNTRPKARPNLVVVSSVPQALPLTAKLLEHHPCSSQTFLPLACRRYLVCVAPPRDDGSPDASQLQAFVVGPGVGINYHAGVWHHPIVALDGQAEFAMLVWEDTSPRDCVVHPLAEPVQVLDGPAGD